MDKIIEVTVKVTVDVGAVAVDTQAIRDSVDRAVRREHSENGLTSENDDSITKSIEVFVTE